MGIVVKIEQKPLFKRWIHKLFKCPTFWSSKWNTLIKSKPFYRCSQCKKAMHCYWDGNDTDKGINFCNNCAKK